MQRLYENYSSIEQMTDRLLQSDNKKTKHSSESDFLSGNFKLNTGKEHIISSHRIKIFQTCKCKTGNEEYQSFRQQMERLENGTTKAREKGIQESLIMVDDLAFIVNVKNNTVITAVGDSTDSIFTNIDGAVIS